MQQQKHHHLTERISPTFDIGLIIGLLLNAELSGMLPAVTDAIDSPVA